MFDTVYRVTPNLNWIAYVSLTVGSEKITRNMPPAPNIQGAMRRASTFIRKHLAAVGE